MSSVESAFHKLELVTVSEFYKLKVMSSRVSIFHKLKVVSNTVSAFNKLKVGECKKKGTPLLA